MCDCGSKEACYLESKDITTKTFEELADIEAYKKAGKDCCEWLLDSIGTHRTRGAADVEIPTDEFVKRKLGFNLDKPYTKAVLESMVKQEIENPRRDPHFTTVAELLAYADSLDGWRDMQHIADTIEGARRLLKKQAERFVTEIGKDFNEAFLKALDEMQETWNKKCDDPPTFTSIADMPTEYNIAFRGLMDSFSEHCLKVYFEVSGESEVIIGKPEDIAGHPIERPEREPAFSDVANISAYLKQRAKAPISPMSSFDTPLYPSDSDAAREAQEQSRRVMEKRQKGR
jgi:hypothetical protein